MEKFNKKTEKLNKKTQKKLEKQSELEKISDASLRYFRAVEVGKSSIAKSIKAIFGLVIAFCAVASMILPFSNLVLGLLLGISGTSLCAATVAAVAEIKFDKKWAKYNVELEKRETRQKLAEMQKEYAQQKEQSQNLVSRKTTVLNKDKEEVETNILNQ